MSASEIALCKQACVQIEATIAALAGRLSELPSDPAWTDAGDWPADSPVPDALAGLPQRLEGAVQRAEALMAAVDDPGHATRLAELQEQPGAFVQELDTAAGEIEAAFADLQGTLDELASALPDKVEETCEAAATAMSAFQETLVATIESELQEAIDTLAEETREQLEEAIEAQVTRFEQAADVMREQLMESLEELKDFAGEELEEGLREEITQLISSTVNDLIEEAAESVVASQINVQLSAALAPILPQLLIARHAAAAIKTALDVMRMKF